MIKKSNSFKLAFSAVITALSLVMLFLTGLIPIGTYALPAIAGVLMCAIVIEVGNIWAWGSYISVSILSSFIAPDKEAVVYFIMFFGIYPILKSIIEKSKSKITQKILKFLIFNITMVLAYLTTISFLNIDSDSFTILGVNLPIIFLIIGNGIFVIYDVAITRIISLYMYKYRKRFFKNI